jgi:hypothetical protein
LSSPAAVGRAYRNQAEGCRLRCSITQSPKLKTIKPLPAARGGANGRCQTRRRTVTTHETGVHSDETT